jgi:hypothetical protein
LKDLDKSVALEIEAKIVEALNESWPESHGDEQTWEDKNEAARGELKKRYPDESEDQIDAWVDAFAQDYCVRTLPYETTRGYEVAESSVVLLEALKNLVRLPLDAEAVRMALKAIEQAEAK